MFQSLGLHQASALGYPETQLSLLQTPLAAFESGVLVTSLKRNEFPDLKIRFINVVDLFGLQPDTEHPHGLSDRDFDSLFTLDKPVIFNSHAYPWMIPIG